MSRKAVGMRPIAEEGLPLFTRQTYKLNYDSIITWAREELLRSDLVRFTAEDVRSRVEDRRGHLLGSARWLGFVFDDHFEYIEHIRSRRPEARGRQIMSYGLTQKGERARAELRQKTGGTSNG